MQLFISCFLALVFVFPIYLISLALYIRPKNKEKLRALAISRGHVVEAVLVKMSGFVRDVQGTHANSARLATYKYTYKNRNYKFRVWSEDPSETLTMYFLKNPRKANPGCPRPESKRKWIILFVILTVFFYICFQGS